MGARRLRPVSRLHRGLDLLDLHRLLFSGLLLASASMSAYIVGGRGVALAQDRSFLLWFSLGSCWLRWC